MPYNAPSIEMSPIASTLGRRDNSLGGSEIRYDEERAETDSRAHVGGTSTWILSRKTLETRR